MLERLTKICLALPEAVRRDAGPHAGFLVRKKQVDFVEDKVKTLFGFGDLAEKCVKFFVSVFLGGGNPYEDIQVFQELPDLLPMCCQKTVKVRKIAKDYVTDRFGVVRDFAPWEGRFVKIIR